MAGFYGVVLNKKVNLKVLEAVDYELYKGLTCAHTVSLAKRILTPICRETDITDLLEETFSMTEYRFGEHVIVDLRPGIVCSSGGRG